MYSPKKALYIGINKSFTAKGFKNISSKTKFSSKDIINFSIHVFMIKKLFSTEYFGKNNAAV